MLHIYILDDEDLARSRIRDLLQQSGIELDIVGESGNPITAISEIRKLKPDVLLLDIQMPGLNGFEVAELLKDDAPCVIFITAYDEFAIQAFEIHAMDYLTKPVRLQRLIKSLQFAQDSVLRQKQRIGLQTILSQREHHEMKRISAITAKGIIVLQTDEILWFEADEKLVYAHLSNKKYRVEFTLDELEVRLPKDTFIRTHRSTIINANAVTTLEPWFSGNWKATLRNGIEITVARRRIQDVKTLIGFK